MAALYFSTSEESSRALSYKAKKGELIRVYRGIYTDVPYEEIEKVVTSKWYEIVHYLFPNAIAAYRTAHELRPIEGTVYIVQAGVARRKIKISTVLTIDLQRGNTTELTEPFVPKLYRSSPTRQFLENLAISRASVKKSLGRVWVEQQLSAVLRRPNGGEKELNEIRSSAKIFSKENGFEHEFSTLNEIISSLLSTHAEGGNLISEITIATSKKIPFDVARIERFQALADYLSRCVLNPAPYTYNKNSWRHLAFFESYFSNYIEGTEFDIDEAEDIVFSGITINDRHQDSHDIMSVYRRVSDLQEMSITPTSPDELIESLQEIHFEIMKERVDKRPGLFKERINKAGSSIFVRPDEVVGTLSKAFETYETLPKGIERAIFMQFMISECHPFDDGNGRLSRIMMNSELHETELHKIIVPTVHRDSYLNGLRQATKNGEFKTLVKVFYQLQHYTASVDWSDYGEARTTLEEHQANLLPDDGVTTFNRVLRLFKFKAPF